MSSCVHVDNKRKYILVLNERTTEGLDNATITAEAKYPIDFTETEKIFLLRLYNYGSNCFLFVHAINLYQFKAKDSEVKPYALCLGKISKNLRSKTWKKKRLKQTGNLFNVAYNANNTSDISDVSRYFMKKRWYKI